MSTAVATIKDVDEHGPIIEWHQHWAELKGRTLYLTQSAQAADVGAIREVIAELNCTSHQSLQGATGFCAAQADKLAAALPNANGKEG